MEFGDILPQNGQILTSLPNYVTRKRLIRLFLVAIFKVSIQLALLYEGNPLYSKIAISKILALKMVRKPFQNFPKIEVFGQFFKNSSKGFPDSYIIIDGVDVWVPTQLN